MNYYLIIKKDGEFATAKSERYIRKEQTGEDTKHLVKISFVEYLKVYLKAKEHRKI